jgi:hypothetical protein
MNKGTGVHGNSIPPGLHTGHASLGGQREQ